MVLESSAGRASPGQSLPTVEVTALADVGEVVCGGGRGGVRQPARRCAAALAAVCGGTRGGVRGGVW